MDNVDLLYDHYKDSFSLIKKSQAERNRFFIILCILIAMLFLFAVDPINTESTIVTSLKEYLNVNIIFSNMIIQSLIWILLLFFEIRYYQTNIYIERQYEYIHSLEHKISSLTNIPFDRESTNYLNSYPFILNLIDFTYKLVFPLLLIVIVSAKILSEANHVVSVLNFFFNFIISIWVITLTITYLCFIHKKQKKG